MKGLTPGRIVHFVNDVRVEADSKFVTIATQKYEHVPSMITGLQDEGQGIVHLSVFYPGVKCPVARISVGFDATGKVADTWHWIEQA
jgi:hypothetical protein